MSNTVKRKSPTARKTAAAQSKARKVRAARARTGSAVADFIARLPVSEEQLHRLALAGILGCAAVLAWYVAGLAGFPAMAKGQLAAVASDAGFKATHFQVRGVKRLNELKVYERALAQRDRAMPLVDIEGLRAELLELKWVEDARVSRQLPDTLVIDIVERKPHAVLRKPDRLVLIDARGNELEAISPQRAKGKLILSGPVAGEQVEGLATLLDAAPAVRPQVKEAAWVGHRRWNLTFKTGQVLALPEGARPAADALVTFARLDGSNRLIGGKVAAFDMRSSGRIYLRIPEAAADAAKAGPKAGAKPGTTARLDKAAKPAKPAKQGDMD